MTDLLTITEVSRRSGVASSALRFYEERGLIRSERAGSGHRRYKREALRRLWQEQRSNPSVIAAVDAFMADPLDRRYEIGRASCRERV